MIQIRTRIQTYIVSEKDKEESETFLSSSRSNSPSLSSSKTSIKRCVFVSSGALRNLRMASNSSSVVTIPSLSKYMEAFSLH